MDREGKSNKEKKKMVSKRKKKKDHRRKKEKKKEKGGGRSERESTPENGVWIGRVRGRRGKGSDGKKKNDGGGKEKKKRGEKRRGVRTCFQQYLLTEVSTLTTPVPMAFSAKRLISRRARGARFLKVTPKMDLARWMV